ncbi:MAG TPA: phasin family protein [Candidatus Dormibacteraeota bacterium]|jgi:hypothetical protein|nr:phasin family protein [Candidatus Dormibacteraeota bacterium]
MANGRPEDNKAAPNKNTQNVDETARRASERTVEQTQRAMEQTRRIGLAAAQAGEEVAQASTHVLQQNAEMLQNSWRFGVDMASAMLGRSTDYLGRTLGMTAGDEAQKATERSVRNAEAIAYSATAVAKGMNDATREYFDFFRKQAERNMDRINELTRCRTPQDAAAVHTDLVRETISNALEASRRMADMSLKVADDAGQHITESIERIKSAA